MKILVLNSGSSSQKSSLYDVGPSVPKDPPRPAWEGKIEWDAKKATIAVGNRQGAKFRNRLLVKSRKHAIERLLDTLWCGETRVIPTPADIDVVGHRVVHGGPEYLEPTVITPEVRAAIARLSIFAPLHNRAELEGMDIIADRLGRVCQIAVFDTAFHRRMPEVATVYPGPYEWVAQGIRRYGFHGINHQYCAQRCAQLLGKDLLSLKLVTCHLGNGCSLAAIRDGHSIDTTMGFTPLEGLMMGTRSGSVDPGILTYLASHNHMTGKQLDELLNRRSGLLGISGISGDMRQIVQGLKQGHSRAKLAFEMFTHRLRSGIGAMVAVLGGIDALVFTAGIGENAPEVRSAACANFGYLGLKLDSAKNRQRIADEEISTADSAVRVLVIQAQEDWAIARQCWLLVRQDSADHDKSQGTRRKLIRN
jgi:acetate kinase